MWSIKSVERQVLFLIALDSRNSGNLFPGSETKSESWVSRDSWTSLITTQLKFWGLGDVLKNVKFSHTRYGVLGPEMIPMYRQSARKWLEAIHPAVGCHYFQPGLWLPYQSNSVTAYRPVPNYTACWQRHVCEQLAQSYYLEADRPRFRTRNLLDHERTLYH